MTDARTRSRRRSPSTPAAAELDELAILRARVVELEAAEAERARALRVQDALYRIADAASAVHDMAEFYPAIHRIVGELMFAENFYIALYDEERQMMNYPYMVDQMDEPIDPTAWHRIGTGWARGTTAYVLRTGSPALMTKERYEELIALGEVDRQGAEGEDWLGVPLRSEGRTVGVLVVQSYETAHRYGDADVDLLAFVGQHVGTALSRVRAIEETRQRNAELSIINEIGTALARELDMAAMYELVGDRVRDLFQASTMFIATYDPETNLISFPYEIDQGERIESEPFAFGPGLTSIVVRTGRPVRFGTQAEMLESGAIIAGALSSSWLGVPMMGAEGVTGVIALESYESNAFSEADERLLGTLATNLGVALEGARLLDQTRQRNAELAVVNSIQAGLAAELDMQAMYDLVGDKVAEIFDTHVVDIATYDRETDLLHFPYGVERGVRLYEEPRPAFGFRRHVLETGQPLLIDDLELQAAEYGNPLTPMSGEQAKSIVFAPLLSGGKPIGVISLQNLDRERAFGRADMDLLATLTASLGVALENARLIDETRRRAAELAIINEIGTALAGALEMTAMYELVGERVRELFETGDLFIAAYDRETNRIGFPYEIANGERYHSDPIELGRGVTSVVIQTGKPLRFGSIAEGTALGAINFGGETNSWLGVPMVAAEGVFGVIALESPATNAFSAADERLLGTLASNLAVALEGARLFDETRRRAAELAIVNEIGTALAGELEMTAMYDLVGDRVRDLFGAREMFIATYDRTTELITFQYQLDKGERYATEPRPFGTGLTSTVIRTGKPLRFGTGEEADASGAINFLVFEDGEETQSWLGVPMMGADGVTGVIALESYQRNAFSEADERLLGTLASNLGVALESARLFDETRRLLAETDQRAAELAIINEIGTALSGELEMAAMYELVGDRLRDLFPGLDPSIAVYDRRTNLISWPYEMENGERVHIFEPRELGPGVTSRIIQTAKPVRTGTVAEADALGAIWIGAQNDSFLGVPMIGPDGVFGVISLYSDETNAFSESDERLLGTLASNLSVALESARLFEETRRLLAETDQRAAELAIINDIGSALSGELEMAAMYELVGDKLRDLFQTTDLTIARYDRASNLITFPYELEGGVRLHTDDEIELGHGITSIVVQTGKPLRIGTSTEADALGAVWSGARTESWLGVPMVGSEGVFGVISLYTFKPNAYTEADERLLTTLASNLAVALQSARLFDETRRLLAEADQRAAELAIVNERRPGARFAPGPGRAHRAARRPDGRHVRRRHRLRGPPRSRVGPHRVRLLQRGRGAPAPVTAHVRRGPDVTDPPSRRAAAPQPGRPVRGARHARGRGPGELVPRRADHGRRDGHRRDQRPEHPRGGPVRRVGHASPDDPGGQRRRRDPERPPLPRRPTPGERDGRPGRGRLRDLGDARR